ncbi:MAG: RNB domain-containing ribonuclease [Gemmatimonadaceae bacterium]|nr:RNB domain-containing ribonuclease [Gemmatimonadaceae bacterium]
MLKPDLRDVARQAMIDEGFDPDFSPEVRDQLAHPPAPLDKGTPKDLRELLWSSIDNDDTRDLDQVEFVQAVDGGMRLLIGIADVDRKVPKGSPIDKHAESQTTTVYTGVQMFPMLPVELSAGDTSMFENQDRHAVIVEIVVASDGSVKSEDVYTALIRNKAQLAYPGVGAWLEQRGEVPQKVASLPGLADQVQKQSAVAVLLRKLREKNGALEIETVEARAVTHDGKVTTIERNRDNAATRTIEDFMVSANGAVARFLEKRGFAAIRRVVKKPDRWPRIVDLAKQFGADLPPEADSIALHKFLEQRRAIDPEHFQDLSLAVVKLMGPGEYALDLPGGLNEGHFGLAVQDYTHSTAPNRRFADLLTQRLVKAALAGEPSPYTNDELEAIARNCTLRENAARKVERKVRKTAAALLLADKIGAHFNAIVTGVKKEGTYVRVIDPPVEGRLMQGAHDVDVGDKVSVKLLSTNPEKGFIDFGLDRPSTH